MKLKKFLAVSAAILGAFDGKNVFAQTQKQQLSRPPQFVLLAFDGSRENNFWQESRDFAKKLEKQLNAPVKFTYFISGVYWLTEENRKVYQGPYRSAGRSDIGFGQLQKDLLTRIDHVNAAYEEGHEIASHANGHFDGSDYANRKSGNHRPWTEADWTSEFQQFNDLIFNVFKNNNITNHTRYSSGYSFSKKDITGFRAPLLGFSDGLWPTLAKFNFRYDTSKVNFSWYWPAKDAFGTWQFPLAEIAIVGTAKKTLSMDYNFYVQQSRGLRDAANKELYKKQMIDSYMKYFNDNYFGRRAPIHIGHHFSRWNDGAYWEAMQVFAENVCGQPEVKCVTYADYANWLDSLNQETLNAYRKGQFVKMAKPAVNLAESFKIYDAAIALESAGDSLQVIAEGTSYEKEKLSVKMQIDGLFYNRTSLSLNDLRMKYTPGTDLEVSAVVFDSNGYEINRATHTIENLGTPLEMMTEEPWEGRALMGDLPEAHLPE